MWSGGERGSPGTSDGETVQGTGRTAAFGSCDRTGGTGGAEFGGMPKSATEKKQERSWKLCKEETKDESAKDHCAC